MWYLSKEKCSLNKDQHNFYFCILENFKYNNNNKVEKYKKTEPFFIKKDK